MVKVTKWDRKKKKEDWANYRAEIKRRKYGVWQNMIYILREIWSIDKTMFFSCFLFAMCFYITRLCATFTDKYVVELVAAGFENTALLVTCILLIVGCNFFGCALSIVSNYQGFVGFNNLYHSFSLKVIHKNIYNQYLV